MGTSIEWVRGEDGSEGATWNFARGCSRVDTACEHCYAQSLAHRFRGKGQPYEGLTVLGKHGPRWTGEVRFLPEALSIPLNWRKGRRVFPCSMSDAFHGDLTNEQIAAAFGVMAATPQHTYVMTTKRAGAMRGWFSWIERQTSEGQNEADVCMALAEQEMGHRYDLNPSDRVVQWPLPNVHLGVSAGTQASADERIADLLETPAVVRWMSLEPLLEPIDLYAFLQTEDRDAALKALGGHVLPGLDWVVVGGESGPGARPCNIEWIEDIVRQCKAANRPAFVKQIGTAAGLRDRKGSDMQEWPEALRVREMPAAKGAV